jgi:PBSX family phage terminase large subunit
VSDAIEIEIDEEVFVPKFRHLLNSTADVNFLWGGRDGAKSYFIAQKLVFDCLSLDYFRCILIKKTASSIQDAQWQTIKDVCEAWEINHLFEFNVKPLRITCKANGNKFIARGLDDPQNVKSIANPSHAWYEEGNQLTLEEYVISSTTLRSSHGNVQQWFSFNPECDGDYESFWLFKNYFKGRGYDDFDGEINTTLPDGTIHTVTYTSTHVTFRDNPYCTPTRKAFLLALESVSPYYYLVYTEGKWGNIENKSPWAFAYSASKHTGLPVKNDEEVYYLSFDFNRNPICCTVIQHYDETIKVLQVIKIVNSNTDELCDHIKILYPDRLFVVTGDASGTSMTAYVKDNMHHYNIIKQKLGLSDAQIQVPSVNPPLKDNHMLMNLVLANYNVEIHETDAKDLHFDMKWVKRLADGTIEKGDRNNPEQQADALDTFRYWVNVFMSWYLNRFTG